MLTQLELLGASGGLGVDEDSGMSASPLDGLAEYPMEQAEFEYFETSLGNDSYYDAPPHQDLQQTLAAPPSLTSPMCDVTAGNDSILIYDQENMATFTADDLKFTQEIKPYEDGMKSDEDDLKLNDDMPSYEDFAENLYESSLGDHTAQDEDFNFGNLYEALDPEQHITSAEEPTHKFWSEATITNTSKGKITPLQRRTLDSIFRVTEKPSRGLVLHIASELGLHHLTVKNFFSNGRRRLRRAAARLNDPERTKRENERRKEKRRLAAMASAAHTEGKGGSGGASSVKAASPRTPPADSPPPKETPVVSPERKALMEKLVDKVQRSVAQRSLAADLDLPPSGATTTTHTQQPAQPAHNVVVQPQSDLLSQASHDLLSQASHDLLTQSTQDLLGQAPHDFLDHSTHLSSPPSLLPPHTDPWDLF